MVTRKETVMDPMYLVVETKIPPNEGNPEIMEGA